jgi:hypothetical protein
MSTQAKKKRQQRAQSRLALARSKQQERSRRRAVAAQRAESRWHKTLRQLAVLGATLHEDDTSTDGNDHPGYVVVFEGNPAFPEIKQESELSFEEAKLLRDFLNRPEIVAILTQ